MKFGECKTEDAAGAILAHAIKIGGKRYAKGRRLSAEDVAQLRGGGILSVTAAHLESGDVSEDEAAATLGKRLAKNNLRGGRAFTGRVNIHAAKAGVLTFDESAVRGFNLIDPAITLATAANFAHLPEGAMAATIKIIPFAVAQKTLAACESAAPLLILHPYLKLRAAILQTRLADTREEILNKTRRITEARLARANVEIVFESRPSHHADKLADSIKDALAHSPDLLLIAGASAICDRRDVIPSAIDSVGGEVLRLGMPVDPGNLLLLGKIKKINVVGMPGCARSPKLNGLDWILSRLCAGIKITSSDIAAMGGGGLLAEIDERPSPRIPKAARRRPVIAAVLLAAGESKRMGKENKLLAGWRGKPLARYAAETLTKAKENGIIDEIIAVTGRDNQLIEDALAELPLTFARNSNYESGMASSIKRGLESVGDKADAALFVLADMPLVSAQTINALAAAINLGGGGGDIAIPICNGKRGNPVLVGRNYFSELAQISGDIGARALFSHFANSIIEVEVSDGGVLFDLDSPSDWQ